MKYLATLLLIFGFGLSAFGQTIKSLGYNTTNGQVVYGGTNVLTFTTIINAEELAHSGDVAIQLANRELISEGQSVLGWGSNYVEFSQPITFAGTNAAPASRTNLGLSLSALTNTSVTNFKTALDLGSFRSPDGYAALYWGDTEYLNVEDGVNVYYPIYWSGTNGDANAAQTRTNLGLGWSALTNTNAATTLLGYDTNGQVVYGGTNVLTFTNDVSIHSILINNEVIGGWGNAVDFGQGILDGNWEFNNAVGFGTPNNIATTRANLGLGWSALTNTNAATSLLGVTTNGQVVYSGTNFLKFVTSTNFSGNHWTAASFGLVSDASFAMNIVVADEGLSAGSYEAPQGSIGSGGNVFSVKYGAPNEAWASPLLIDAPTQVHFGATWLTNTNVTNFRSAIGLGATNNVTFSSLQVDSGITVYGVAGIFFDDGEAAAATRANLGFSTNLNTLWTATNASNARTAIGLGATNQPTFSGMYVSDGTNAVFYAVSSINVFELYSPLWFGDRNSTNAIFQFEIDTDAAIARANLGLGGGITATNTFVSYNGTNYTTNTVTIINGIITGWTQ